LISASLQAVKMIDSRKKWGARVVYGDTDSLFIYLQGKSKDQAFRIGHDIADSITALNPAPIKLKFEKVIYYDILVGSDANIYLPRFICLASLWQRNDT
jgi:DNA polymerase elongation subunit (family B)